MAQNQTMAVRGLKPSKVLLVGEAMGLFTAGEEGRMLFGADCPQNVADAFLAAGATCVVVKDGPNGAYAANGERSAYVPGFVVDHVVDTVGCGDGFAAGVLSSLMEGNALPEAAERGCAIGAIQAQSVSDNEGLPDVEELSRFMASHDRVNGFA